MPTTISVQKILKNIYNQCKTTIKQQSFVDQKEQKSAMFKEIKKVKKVY